MANRNRLSSLMVPGKTLKAITPETADECRGRIHQSHCPPNDILRDVNEDRGGEHNASRHDGVDEGTRLWVSAWMNQHSLRDAVTEWVCLMLNMDEDDAGLNVDDNPSPIEETDATADETIQGEWKWCLNSGNRTQGREQVRGE